MRWPKNSSLFVVFFSFWAVLFGTLVIEQNNVSAVSDLVYTYDSSNWSGQTYTTICDSSQFVCSDYHYLIISAENTTSFPYNNDIAFYYYAGSYRIIFRFLPFYSNNAVISLTPSSNFSLLFYASTHISNLPSSFSVTFRLTENSPFSSPSGSLSITENGTYDVTNYAEAVVDVPISSGGSSEDCNYHDDLVTINNSILICGAICLVLYFFYCIYRMFIKTTGGF